MLDVREGGGGKPARLRVIIVLGRRAGADGRVLELPGRPGEVVLV